MTRKPSPPDLLARAFRYVGAARRSIFIIVLAVVLLLFFVYFETIFLVLVLSALLAYLLEPVADLIMRYTKLGRGIVVSLLFLTLLGILTLAVVLAFPDPQLVLALLDELEASTEPATLLVTMEGIQKGLAMSLGLEHMFSEESNRAMAKVVAQTLSDGYRATIAAAEELIIALPSYIIYLLIVPLFAFFLLKDKPLIFSMLRRYTRDDHEDRLGRIFGSVHTKIGGYIKVQLVSSFVIAIVVWPTLEILGQDYAILLALFAGLINLVPFIGQILGVAVIGLTVGLASGIGSGEVVNLADTLIAVGVSSVTYFLVAYGLQPALLKGAANLHPMVSILVVIMGGTAGGILGMLVAVPIAIVAQEILWLVLDETIKEI